MSVNFMPPSLRNKWHWPKLVTIKSKSASLSMSTQAAPLASANKPKPEDSVTSSKVPSPRLRNIRHDDVLCNQPSAASSIGPARFAKKTSVQPSPSASPKATPEPMSSGNRPLRVAAKWLKMSPASAVTSVNETGGWSSGNARPKASVMPACRSPGT